MTLTTVLETIDDLDVSPGSGYAASFIYSFHQPGSSATVVERAEGPVVTAVAPGLHRLSPLEIVIEDTDDPEAYQVALFRALDTTEAAKALVISDADGGNRRYVMFVTESLQQKPDTGGLAYVATLIVHEDIRWRGEDQVVEELTYVASGQAEEIAVIGHLPVYPTYTLTPRAAKSVPGWPHMLYSVVRWRSPLQSDRPHPIDLTGGGWDTAALVTAGDLSNNTNIGVLSESGKFIPFWYGDDTDGGYTGFNDESTKIWINHPTSAGVTLELREFAGAADESATMRIVPPQGGMPFTSGWLRFEDGELISFNGYVNGTLLNVMRGLGDTTPSDHEAGETLEKVFVYRIVYGPASSVPARLKDTAYRAAERMKPVINRKFSTNAIWRQDTFRSGQGTGGWRYIGDKSAAFTEETAEPDGVAGSFVEPWTAMGFRHDISRSAWYSVEYPIPLWAVRVIGNRFAFGYEIDYPGAPQVAIRSHNLQERVVLWDAGADTETDAFDETIYTPTVADMANPELFEDEWRFYDRIHFEVTNTNHIQTDIQQAFIVFVEAYAPIVTLIDTENSYDMAVSLANLTTGEELFIDVQNIDLDESVVINTLDSTVVYTGDNSNRYAGVQTDAPRPFFLKLAPGLNNLAVFESGLVEMDVTVRYTPRYYR